MDRDTLERLDYLAEFSDDAIEIPGTGIRFGIDPLIGLIPGIGDAAGSIFSGYIIFEACRHRLPPSLILRMILVALAELFIGSIPVIGDIFDFAWKANRRNVDLIKGFLRDQKKIKRSSRLIVTAVFLPFLVAILFFLFLLWRLFDWVLQLNFV